MNFLAFVIPPSIYHGILLTRFKEFRTFWPCYFIYLSVKGTNKLWKARGLIDDFDVSRRRIASGVGKTEYELMSAIQFCTSPKGDLSHTSYIFRNPDTFWKEINDVACSRLGTMLHL